MIQVVYRPQWKAISSEVKMSTKFHIVYDHDRDGFFAALKRYALVLLALLGILVAVLAIVFSSSIAGTRGRQAETAEANATLAAERAEMVAVQQAAKRLREEGGYSRHH